MKYKPTGIKWIPEIPEHWKTTPLWALFNDNKKKNENLSESNVLSLSYGNIIRRNIENNTGLLPESFETYQILEKGDIVLRLTDLQNDKRSLRVGLVKESGIITSAYTGLVLNSSDCVSDYFYYLLHSLDIKKYFYGLGGGVRQSIGYKELKWLKLPVPPLEEQNKIIAFIESKTVVINHFISQKQQLITLLKEQRQSIINEKLSEKGKKVKIKFCVTKVGAGVTPTGGATVYQESGVLFLRSQNVHNDGLRLNDVAYISKEINSEMKGSQVKYEDVLINITGASIGRCFVFDKREDANVNQHVCILRPKKDTILSEYLMLQLQSDRIQTLINMIEGASREGLTNNELKNYFIFVPSLKEQLSIISNIKSDTQKIDHTISQAEKEIELIKEYKEAMIAEAVMGKVNIKKAKVPQSITTKKEANWEFKEAVLISVLTDKFGSERYPLGRKRYTKYSYLFHRHTDNKTEGYLKKAAGPYNPKTKYGGPEKIALQNKYVSEVQNGNLSGFVASDKIEDARNYFGDYWNTESLNWLEQLRYKKNDELELYATVDKAMVELAENNKDINLQLVKQIIDENPEWKPKLERDIFSDDNITKAMEFLKTLFQ